MKYNNYIGLITDILNLSDWWTIAIKEWVVERDREREKEKGKKL